MGIEGESRHIEELTPFGRRPTRQQQATIEKFGSREITVENFQSRLTKENIQLIRDVLFFHPNSIVRHEAAFVIGELDIDELMPCLYKLVKYDSSIVVKHEALEALGKARNQITLRQNLAFMHRIEKIKYDQHDHPDIIATIQEARKSLEEQLLITS